MQRSGLFCAALRIFGLGWVVRRAEMFVLSCPIGRVGDCLVAFQTQVIFKISRRNIYSGAGGLKITALVLHSLVARTGRLVVEVNAAGGLTDQRIGVGWRKI